MGKQGNQPLSKSVANDKRTYLPLLVKHGWLENPRAEWRFVAGKITDFNGPFSSRPCLITGGYHISTHLQDDIITSEKEKNHSLSLSDHLKPLSQM